MFGLSLQFDLHGTVVGTFVGHWGCDRREDTEWTEEDRLRTLGETCILLRDTLAAAGKTHVDELSGTPVEVELDGNKLVSWRVLEEVL